MAGRDINIPFGPDRTGEFDLSSILPEVEPSGDEQNESAVEEAADPTALPESAFEAASAESYGGVASDYEPESEPDLVSGVNWDSLEASAEEVAADADGANGQDEQSSAKNALGDVQASLAALKDSIGQGRELKAREKQREEFGEKLDADREELADREDILANYQAIVAEQDDIIHEATERREIMKNDLAQLVAQQEDASTELERTREYNQAQLQPVEAALGRAKAAAEQTKNDERSRKSELNAAESEKRRAEGGGETGMAVARFEVVQRAYDEAVARSEAAKDELAAMQKRYDDVRERIEQSEAPLERSIESLQAQIDELKENVNQLGEEISIARKRRQYCDNVYQFPEETYQLRAAVEADEETARRMDVENDELRDMLAESKQRSRTAKLAIAGVIALIIILVIVFVFVLR